MKLQDKILLSKKKKKKKLATERNWDKNIIRQILNLLQTYE